MNLKYKDSSKPIFKRNPMKHHHITKAKVERFIESMMKKLKKSKKETK